MKYLLVLLLLCPLALAEEAAPAPVSQGTLAAQEAQPPRQTELETFFSPAELEALERLVAVAQERSPTILQAAATLRVGEAQLEIGGRLADALSLNVGAGVSGDFYGQLSPSYSISAGVDVVALAVHNDQTTILRAGLAAARASARAETAGAFVRYVVSRQSVQAAALAVDSSDAAFRVVQARLEIGESTISDQLAAQSAVSSSAVALLRANGELVIALEQLAATVGLSPQETLEVIRG
ncbi:MAG: TolC family protein [Deinococcota bacterium]|nr:TolC family protein [Deinococcota bacterium]